MGTTYASSATEQHEQLVAALGECDPLEFSDPCRQMVDHAITTWRETRDRRPLAWEAAEAALKVGSLADLTVGGARAATARADREQYEATFAEGIVDRVFEFLDLLEQVETDTYSESRDDRTAFELQRDRDRLVRLGKQIAKNTKRWADTQ